MILKAYKYRLYPDAEAREKLAQHFGAARFVYNTALDLRKRYYEQFGRGISKRDVQNQFVTLKKTDEFVWLYDINSQAILATLGHVHTAFSNFFSGRARFPRFKSKKSGWQSYQCPQHVQVDFEYGMVKIPKIGWVKAKFHRSFEGAIKTCTIKRNPSGHYTISVLVETEETLPTKPAIDEQSTIGLDLGLKHFLIQDDGSKIDNPQFLQQGLERLGIEQKKLSRKKKGSNQYKKQKQIVAKTHNKISNQRHNFLHQTSSMLLRDNQAATVAMEDLHVKGMVRNKKLSRHIIDVAWGKFVELVAYKCDWRGKNLIFANRWAPTSKQCACGTINHELKLSDRQWCCPDCGASHDRDVLAANNIKTFALVDALGMKEVQTSGVCVKSSPLSKPVHAGDNTKGTELSLYGSHEAPPIVAVAT